MEAVAPGRAWRGWRRAAAAGSPRSLAALLFLSALLRAPLAVGYLVRLPRSFRLAQDSLKIVGSTHFPVSVYVMLHQRSPHVLCATQQLRNTELVDPSFQWHGPKGKVVSVICSPGSYNPRDGIHCLQCNNSLVYGAKACV